MMILIAFGVSYTRSNESNFVFIFLCDDDDDDDDQHEQNYICLSHRLYKTSKGS